LSLGLEEDLTEFFDLGFVVDLLSVELRLQLIELAYIGTLANERLFIIRLKSFKDICRVVNEV